MLSAQEKKITTPLRLVCSITGQMMSDPVMTTADGHTYEREAIERWLLTHNTSPKTGQVLKHKELMQNWDKKSDVSEFLSEHPELDEELYLPVRLSIELLQAIKAGQLETVERLLDQDKRLWFIPLENDYTAFHVAADYGSIHLTDFLIKRLASKGLLAQLPSAPKSFKGLYLNQLLEQSLMEEDLERATFLVGLGASIQQPEVKTGNTLLHRLTLAGKLKSVAYCLEQEGSSLEFQNEAGNTPLLLAVFSKHAALVDLLLKRKANLKVQNKAGETPVFVAVLNHDKAILSLLLPPEIATLPPLHIALALKNKGLLSRLLLQNTVALEALDQQQRTPFYVAVEQGDTEAAQLLLERGASFNSQGIEGLRPLHLAAHQGQVLMVRELLKRGVAVDLRTLQEETPLHFAAKAGQDAVIPLLLEAGANRKAKNAQHQTPMELALLEKHLKTFSLIEDTAYALKQARLEENKHLKALVTQQSEQLEQQARQLEALKLALSDEKKARLQSEEPLKQEVTTLQKKLGLNVKGLEELKSDLIGKLSEEKEERLKSEKALPQMILSFRHQIVEIQREEAAKKVKLTAEANAHASKFLRLVAEGEQEQAEAMLEKNPYLGLVAGTVEDLSQRTFEGITGFQYAVWALDWHMWTILLKYLSPQQACIQLQETGNWVKAYGLHAAEGLNSPLQKLLAALKTYIDNYNEWRNERAEEARKHWTEKVGGAQLLLPAHVIHEYCRPDHAFYPCPNFKDLQLPRTRIIDGDEWFSGKHGDGKIGINTAVVRGNRADPCKRFPDWLGVVSRVTDKRYRDLQSDYKALLKLNEVRMQDLEQLFLSLGIDKRQAIQRKFGT